MHSPVGFLFPELLSNIFSLCLPPEPYIYPNPDCAPWVLCMVCSHWRSVAISTPSLWCSISTHSLLHMEKASDLVRIWLSRVGALPLSIYFTDDGSRRSHHLFELILSHSSFWRKVEYNLTPVALRQLREIQRGAIPRLESFTLISPWTNSVASNESFDIFQGAPRLRSVRLLLEVDPLVFKLPFAQLTNFHANYITSVAGWLKLFQEFLVLSSCMCYIYDTSNMSLPLRTARLPSLHSLQISATQPLGSFFEHLILPALSELIIEDEGSNHFAWPQEEFMSFLSAARSASSLRSLRIINTTISANNVIECLQQCPFLIELSLHDNQWNNHGAVTDQLLALLTYRPKIGSGELGCLCPRLQGISFIGGNYRDDSIISLVNSRWIHGPVSKGDISHAPLQVSARTVVQARRDSHLTYPMGIIQAINKSDMFSLSVSDSDAKPVTWLRSLHVELKRSLTPDTVGRLTQLEKEGLFVSLPSENKLRNDNSYI